MSGASDVLVSVFLYLILKYWGIPILSILRELCKLHSKIMNVDIGVYVFVLRWNIIGVDGSNG